MPSDIDDLLAGMRRQEAGCRKAAALAKSRKSDRMFAKFDQEAELDQADRLARYIAAVEELVAFKLAHNGSRGHDVTDLYEDPDTSTCSSCGSAHGDPTNT